MVKDIWYYGVCSWASARGHDMARKIICVATDAQLFIRAQAQAGVLLSPGSK